jgi:hypothetical protein
MAAYLEKGLQAEVVLSDPLSRLQVAASIQQEVIADRMGSAPAIGLAIGSVV